MPLKNWDVKIYRGVLTGFNEAFIIDTETKEKLCKEDPKSSEIIKPILRGRDIGRYYYKWAGMWLIFVPWHFPLHKDENIQGASKKAEETFIKQYPVIYKHLEQFKESLSSRNKDETGIRYEWYALQRCAATYYPEFEKEKIVYQEMTNKGSFAWDTNRIYVNQTCYIMTNTNKYILALLNSRIIHFYFSQISYALGIGAFRWIKQFVEQIPIPNISEIQRKPFIDIVDKILAITKDPEGKPLASNGAGGDYLENPAKQTQVRDYEKQIDQLVYELYGLTDEEIKIVEGSRS